MNIKRIFAIAVASLAILAITVRPAYKVNSPTLNLGSSIYNDEDNNNSINVR
ncbi:MAG: hypothetical protein IJV71_04415 [Lachnospiraceae bacterium]|nr:hypothetical protein [Lachnospiraceae bacterium]